MDDVGTPQGTGIGQVHRDGELVCREGPDSADVVGGTPEQLEAVVTALDVVAEEAPVGVLGGDFLPQQDEVVDVVLPDLVEVVALPAVITEVEAEGQVKVDEAQVLPGLGQGLLGSIIEGLVGDLDHAEAEADVEDADLGADGEGDFLAGVDPGVDLDVVCDVSADGSEDRSVRVELDGAVLGRGGQGNGQSQQGDQGEQGFETIHGSLL